MLIWAFNLAIGLYDQQKANALADKRSKIISVAGIDAEGESVADLFAKHVETRLVDFKTGDFVAKSEDGADAASYNQREASKVATESIKLTQSKRSKNSSSCQRRYCVS